MKKSIAIITMILIIASILSSCEVLKKPIDKRSGFSKYLKETENYIRMEDWENAKLSLENSKKIWKKLRPMLQIDIDHDYVNDIENNFIKLGAYIETHEKPHSLALILIIQNDWETIYEM